MLIPGESPLWLSKSHLESAVYAEAVLMVFASALMISRNKMGAFLLACAVSVQAITADNPLAQSSQVTYELAIDNLLKDVAIIAACLLLAFRTSQKVHRRDSHLRQ